MQQRCSILTAAEYTEKQIMRVYASSSYLEEDAVVEGSDEPQTVHSGNLFAGGGEEPAAPNGARGADVGSFRGVVVPPVCGLPINASKQAFE